MGPSKSIWGNFGGGLSQGNIHNKENGITSIFIYKLA
jgi:hypothetical protein